MAARDTRRRRGRHTLSGASVDARDFERRRMANFHGLTDDERRLAIRQMSRDGASPDYIAAATLISVEAVAAVLAEVVNP